MSDQFLRQYRLKVITFGGKSIDVSEVRCTFRAEKRLIRLYQWADILLYNLSPDTETNILQNGQYVILEAGYRAGAYGVIFEGFIHQPIRSKEDETTYVLQLVCVDGEYMLGKEFCNVTLSAGQTGQDIAKQVARSSTVPFDIQVDPLQQGTTTRGKVIFSEPQEVLRSLAINNNAAFYNNNGKPHITALGKAPPPDVLKLNAKTGLIGMPDQTDDGIKFRCLINPAIDLDKWVKLNNRDIIPARIEFGVPQTLLDLDGLYRVIGIVATGDTRGDDWYFECDAISQAGKLPQMLADSSKTGF